MSKGKNAAKGLPSSATLDFEVRAPFKIMEDNRRRFIRIDIDEPLAYRVIKSAEGTFWPENDGPTGKGEILNISAGGILMFTEQPIMEDAIVVMELQLEGVEPIENILGLVKRVELDSGGYLVGIESITREKLSDILTAGEIEQISDDVASFTERLQVLLNRYVYSKKLKRSENED